MKRPLSILAAALVLGVSAPAMTFAGPTSQQHHDARRHTERTQASQLKVTHAWIRILPGALPGAGYAVIRNHGNRPAVIVAAHSRFYGNIMLHRSRVRNGMSQMIAVPKLTVPPHGRIQLRPGSYHLMMMHAKHPVQVGHMVPVTLKLADGSTLEVRFKGRPANASGDTQ